MPSGFRGTEFSGSGTVARMNVTVVDNPEKSRYEARVDGRLAGMTLYERKGDHITFTHTEVGDVYEGEGVGSALARFALDDARANKLTLRPRCPFIRSWIHRHPDYQYLVGE
jgi:predicted GNAT family acetyltransferase